MRLRWVFLSTLLAGIPLAACSGSQAGHDHDHEHCHDNDCHDHTHDADVRHHATVPGSASALPAPVR